MAVTLHRRSGLAGSGYTRRFEVERLYRDAEITQICEATNSTDDHRAG
jgi:alkylation response protein AidB-like acyl-CoA dehydrogenase